MCYFKLLENKLKQYFAEYKQATVSEEQHILQAKIKLLKEILAYIKQGSWGRTQDSVDRVMLTLREGPAVAAKKYETSLNCIYVGLSKASKKVERLIGADVLAYLDKGEVEVARFLFYKNTKQLQDILVKPVLDKLPTETENKYELKECAEELKHLKVYTTTFIERILSKCDTDKLAYIGKLLRTQDKTCIRAQHEVYKYFTK